MELQDKDKFILAKSLTELAIQYNYIDRYEDTEATAIEISKFFNTIIRNIGTSNSEK